MAPPHFPLVCLPLGRPLGPPARGRDPPPTRQSAEGGPPDYSVRISAYFDAAALATFVNRVHNYVDLRSSLVPGLPRLAVTTNPDEIDQAENALAKKIREARAAARQGDIFTPP